MKFQIMILFSFCFLLMACHPKEESKESNYSLTMTSETEEISKEQFTNLLDEMQNGSIKKKPIEITYNPSIEAITSTETIANDEEFNSEYDPLSAKSTTDSNNLPQGSATLNKRQGNIYIMWGNLEDDGSKYEWERIFYVVRWLSKKGFKVIINPYSLLRNVKEALMDKEIKVFIWSGHGDTGVLRDKEFQVLPQNIFTKVSPSLKEVIFSSCDGDLLTDNYRFSESFTPYYWSGKTNSKEFLDFLLSPRWIELLSADLEINLQ